MMKRFIFSVVASAFVLPTLVGCGGISGPAFARVVGDVSTVVSNNPDDLTKLPSPGAGTFSSNPDDSNTCGPRDGANAMAEGMDSFAKAFSNCGPANAYAKGDGAEAISDSTGRRSQ